MRLSILNKAIGVLAASAAFQDLPSDDQVRFEDVCKKAIEEEKRKLPRHKSTTTPEHYYHFKEEDIAEAWNDGFTHSPTHVTVFARPDAGGRWYMTWAMCHPVDSFSRAKGRHVARRKWFQDDANKVFINEFIDAATPPTFDRIKAFLPTILK